MKVCILQSAKAIVNESFTAKCKAQAYLLLKFTDNLVLPYHKIMIHQYNQQKQTLKGVYCNVCNRDVN